MSVCIKIVINEELCLPVEEGGERRGEEMR
jgi:hypothetical protein